MVPAARPSIRPAAMRHGRQPRRRVSATRASGRSTPSSSGGQRRRESAPGPVAVDEQRSEGGQHEEHQHQVEQRGAAHHEVQTVHGEQCARQAAQERRAEQPPADPAEHQHRQRAEHRDHEAPAEGREPEQLLADADDPLADRRMHHVAGVGRDRDGRRVLEDRACRRPWASCPRTPGGSAPRRPWRSTSRRISPPSGLPRFQNRSTPATSATSSGPPQAAVRSSGFTAAGGMPNTGHSRSDGRV